MTAGRPGFRPQAQYGTAFDLRSYRHPKAYVRVSTDEQAEEGTSIAVQTKQLQAYFGAFGLQLGEDDLYVDDGWSGKDLARPAMERLRSDARQGRVDCVLVTKLDRFSRNLRDTVNLCLGEWHDEAPPDRRVVLKSVTEPFDTHTDFGRMVFGLLAMFAEFERRRIAERTWAGKASRAEAGRNAGQRAPYGFELVPGPDGNGSTFGVVAAEAEVIRRICHLYLSGFGDEQIAHTLNEDGQRYRQGVLWQTQHVTRILTNPLISGTYAYGRHSRGPDGAVRRLPESQWVTSLKPAVPTPIITTAEFEQLKAVRATRRTAGRAPARSYLLGGLVRCGACGAACTVKTSGPAGSRHRYYTCTRRRRSGSGACRQPNVRLDELEQLVESAIDAVIAASAPLLGVRVREQLQRQQSRALSQVQELQGELARLQKTRQEYFAWLEQGLMRPDAVQQRLDELTRAEQQLTEEHRQAELGALAFSDQGQVAAVTMADLSDSERLLIVRSLITRVAVKGRQVVLTWAHNLQPVEFVGRSHPHSDGTRGSR